MKEKLDQTPEPPIDEETNGSDKNPEVKPAADLSIQQQFNELKREYLNDRSNSMNRLLVFICIVLVFFTVMIPIVTGIAAYLVYEKFESIQSQLQNRVNEASEHATDAEKHANAAAQSLKEIENHQTKLKEIVSKLTSKDFNNPHKVEIFKTTIEDIQQNSDLSLENKAIIEAYRLQNAGEIPEAIEKWRSIANTAKGVNDNLVARAFFSIGYLHSEENENDQAISAYDQSIELMPDFADAYTGRGVVKSKLGDAEEAVIDHDEAIRLKPDFAEAYINRGRAKRALKKYEEAIADYDEAIRLNPNFVEAYINRGAAKRELGQMSAAEKDMQKALQLAQEQEESNVDGE